MIGSQSILGQYPDALVPARHEPVRKAILLERLAATTVDPAGRRLVAGPIALGCRRARRPAVATRTRISTACLLLCLSGCASTPDRPADSTVGCASAVVATLPDGLTDPEKHCVASAGITRRCSPFESWLAGWGKEIDDALGHGDASWEDLAADRAGRRCATAAHGDRDALIECCRKALAQPDR